MPAPLPLASLSREMAAAPWPCQMDYYATGETVEADTGVGTWKMGVEVEGT